MSSTETTPSINPPSGVSVHQTPEGNTHDTQNTHDTGRQEGCRHCGLPCDSEFCCAGCSTIFQTITSLGLTEYYKWREPQSHLVRGDSNFPEHLFNEFSVLTPSFSDDLATYTFEISGIHCAGCLWLLEKLPRIQSGVVRSILNATTGELTVTYRPANIALGDIARLLARLGYPPKSPSAAEAPTYDAVNLVRIGVAGFAAMNTMMLAVSLFEGIFTGIEENIASFFRWVSLLLATPCVCWAGLPLYQGALKALCVKRIHIELPLMIAIFSAYILSAVNTLWNEPYVYFDAVCLLIFLLLLSRHVQNRAVQAARRGARIGWSLLPATARVQSGDALTSVNIQHLIVGDIVVIGTGERVPADGELLSGHCVLDQSILTGESDPESVPLGGTVSAGSLNTAQEISIRVAKTGEDTRVGKLLATLRNRETEKGQFSQFTDAVGRWYLVALGCAALVTLALHIHSPLSAAEAVLTLFIVTCPCALAFSAPTIYGIAIGDAASCGILVKSTRALEDLTTIGRIFIDKTGTITAGTYTIKRQRWFMEDQAEGINVLGSMTALQPKHPVSASLRRELNLTKLTAGESQVIPGRGVVLNEDGSQWRLGVPEWASEASYEGSSGVDTTVLLTKNKEVIAEFILGDELRPDSKGAVAALSKQFHSPVVLSGDRQSTVQEVAHAVDIEGANAIGGLSPEEKAAIISSSKMPSVFIGDGVNDVLAMQAASFGIALSGGLEATAEAADVVITTGSLASVVELTGGAKRARLLILISLGISLVYNFTAAVITVLGHMNPVIAAFLMPTSSALVMGIALLLRPFKGGSN